MGNTLDLTELKELLELLRSQGATEYQDGTGLRIVLRPDVPPMVAPSQEYLPRPKMSPVERLFNGRVPSFADFKNAGMVTEEK